MSSTSEETEPWLEYRFNRWEINLFPDCVPVINCCANQVIELDKLFGPLCAVGVRIRLEYTDKVSDWVVEREVIGGNPEWVEVCRFDCQQDWPELETDT